MVSCAIPPILGCNLPRRQSSGQSSCSLTLAKRKGGPGQEYYCYKQWKMQRVPRKEADGNGPSAEPYQERSRIMA